MKKGISLILFCMVFFSILSAEEKNSIVDSSLIENETLKFKILSHEKRLKEQKHFRLENEIRELSSSLEYEAESQSHFERAKYNLKDAEDKIQELESKLKLFRLDNNISDDVDIAKLKGKTEESQNFLNSYKDKLSEYNRDLQISQDDLERTKKELDEIKEVQHNIENKKKELYQLSNSIFELDNKLYDLFNRDSLNNKFRLNISIAFVLLVALVIIGFYWIAIRKESVAKNIFSGEKGIQFITLFLIIIAIILFGIMGTLESRELSALLGALSGYILGKTSVPQRDEKNENKEND